MSTTTKVVLVGSGQVGKTFLCEKLSNATKKKNQSYKTTIGADFYTHRVHSPDIGDCVLQLWDTSGSQRYISITTAYLRGSSAILMLYDVTSVDSFEMLTKFHEIVYDMNCTNEERNKKNNEPISKGIIQGIVVAVNNPFKYGYTGIIQNHDEVGQEFAARHGYSFITLNTENWDQLEPLTQMLNRIAHGEILTTMPSITNPMDQHFDVDIENCDDRQSSNENTTNNDSSNKTCQIM